MKKMQATCAAAMLFLAVQLSAGAQDDPRPFNPLAAQVENAIKQQLPDWTRTSIPPPHPDGAAVFPIDVIIDLWQSDEARVKVAILIHPSEDEAKKKFGEFVASIKSEERLQDIGSEAYVWGFGKDVALREGRYTAYISGGSNQAMDMSKPPPPPPKENKYSKRFAELVAQALKEAN